MWSDPISPASTVTVPLQPAETDPEAIEMLPVLLPPPPPPPAAVIFPLDWLVRNGSLPLRYRAATEILRVPPHVAHELGAMPYAEPLAIRLALTQRSDGCWGNSILSAPAPGGGVEGIGMIPALQRLVEYGWERESPPLLRARRLLFRLLAEDNDPAYIFEFAEEAGGDEDMIHRARGILREAAAATLAQAGYERDPRLRGAAMRLLERVADYQRSPLAQRPWVRVGNRQVLAPEAAPPSIYLLTMLAHMPLFCSEFAEQLDRVFDGISQTMPRQESVQLVGDQLVPQPHLVLGDPLPHRNAADADVPFAVMWLELMTRLNLIRRCEHWQKLLDRFMDDRDREGIWHPHKGMEPPTSSNPYVWPYFPLDAETDGEHAWTDVTFRLGLIARLGGRPIELQ